MDGRLHLFPFRSFLQSMRRYVLVLLRMFLSTLHDPLVFSTRQLGVRQWIKWAHWGGIMFMYCISLCLLVLRQLDRLHSIAPQSSLTLKVTGTLNELVINIFTISALHLLP